MTLQEMTRDELVVYATELRRKLLESKKTEARLREADEALRASEQRFRTLFERARDSIMIIDIDGDNRGQIVAANRVAAEMHGYEMDELLALKISDLDTPDSAAKNPERIKHILKGEWLSEETSHRTKKGDVFEVEISAGLIELENHKYSLTIERDITERKEAEDRLKKSEAELRASHAQFQAFMDNSPVIAFMRDDLGRYVYVNRPYLNNYNLTSTQVLGKTAVEIFPEEMARQVTKEDLNVVDSTATVSSVESLIDHTGVQREWWLFRFPVKDADGQTYVGGVGLDLTERLKVQRALEASEARFRQIYEMIPLMVHSVDRDGVIRNVNRKWLSHMGYDREEVIGRCVDDFLVKSSATESSIVRSHLWTRGTASNVQRRWVKKNGRSIDTVFDSIIMDDPVLGRVSLTAVHDITALKRAEEQIKKSLEEKEVLLREINHRVKNNLQVISSLLRLQARQVSEESFSHALLETQNRLHTIALIHEKLYQSKNLAHVDVEPYLKSLVADIFYLYGTKSSQIETTIDAGRVSLGVDKADPLGLIANELVSNCLKHAFPGGRKGIVGISFASESDQFHFKVSDNGVGLGENFDPFNAQTLGLELVNTLVKQLRGEMTVKRTAGTEFRIRFPVSTS
jgi:PAS domain S-box-containing protein